MAPVLGYWKIRGLAQPIRLLLAYAEPGFEQKDYTTPEEWFDKDKFNLGLDFPNLPYYIDGDIKMTQSCAIMRHIARKHGLCGTSVEEKAAVDMTEQCMFEYRLKFSMLCYNADYENQLEGYKKDVKGRLESLEKYIGDKKFLVGDKITYVDFMLYDFLDIHKIFDKTLVEPHKKLMEFADRIENLPAISAYKKSDKYVDRPINGPQAHFA